MLSVGPSKQETGEAALPSQVVNPSLPPTALLKAATTKST